MKKTSKKHGKIKIGLIGGGYWGQNHARVLSEINCNFVGIADTDPAKQALADQYHVPYFNSYQKLILQTDAVIVVTPPQTHYAITKAALSAGKHVLVEKPITTKLFQAKRLVSLAKIKHLQLAAGHVFLYTPAYQYIKSVIKNKELGEIYYIYSRRVNFGIIRSDVNVIDNLIPHDLSIVVDLLGKPLSVQAFGYDLIQPGIHDIGFIHLKYPKKVSVHIHLSWLDPQKQRQLIIVGSKKMLIYDDIEAENKIKIYNKSVAIAKAEDIHKTMVENRVGDMRSPFVPNVEALAAVVAHFRNCILEKTEPVADGKAGWKVVQLLEAANQSIHQEGQPVTLYF